MRGETVDIVLERVLSLIPRKPDGRFAHGAQKEFAEKLGFKDGHVVSEWIAEKNTSYRNYLYQISAIYNVSVEWLKGETDETKKDPSAMTGEEVDEECFNLAKELQENYDLRRILFSMRGEDPQNVKNVADMLESFRKRRDD